MTESVDDGDYYAKVVPARRGMLHGVLRRIYRIAFLRVPYDTLLLPYGVMRHRLLLKTANRTQDHTYTCFYRAPAQLSALLGPVVDFVLDEVPQTQPLNILVFACSNGAEAYTLASALLSSRPDLDFRISASDLLQEMVEKAASAVYSSDEVWHGEYITPEFVRRTFNRCGDTYVVKPHIRARVSFAQASLLDSRLGETFQPADIVLAQNVLCHLDPQSARLAFANLVGLLSSRAALLIAGADHDLKCELTEAAGLLPLDHTCREIYKQWRAYIPLAWWRDYYGAEPWCWLRDKRALRYSTILLKDA